MQNEADRLADRFQPLFDNGLMDIKFFVPQPEACTLDEVLVEAGKIQEVISAGNVVEVPSLDADFARVAFDAPF